MHQTMVDVRGAGLAAPQMGVNKQIFTYSVDGQEGHVINPVLVASDDLAPAQEPEGCLSVPGLGFKVERHRWVRITGVDKNGHPIDMEATGMLAKCFQHETDHLDGQAVRGPPRGRGPQGSPARHPHRQLPRCHGTNCCQAGPHSGLRFGAGAAS